MSTTDSTARTESDLLGAVEVPAHAIYGAHTQRAVGNFPTPSAKTIGDYPAMVESLVQVKLAACHANRRLGVLDDTLADVIVRACHKVLDDGLYDAFPIHYLHGGGGTSANMNANEVVANLANLELKGKLGTYNPVHPNDHVNCNQSTNDVYPTACRMSIIASYPRLDAALQQLHQTLVARADELRQYTRIARTCLQDAVDISFGDMLDGYAAFVCRTRQQCSAAVQVLYTVNIGGTIVGRSQDVTEGYRDCVLECLCAVTGDAGYQLADNFFDAAQNADDMASVSAQLAITARGLIKIAQDFRLISSGPEAGFDEIVLPAVQAGSSIMPGKVNPVIPEFLIQACFQSIGNDAACQTAFAMAELDLNIWESTMVFSILDSIRSLSTAVTVFDEKCMRGFTIDQKVNERNADSIIPLLTRLMHQHGYSKISEICKQAGNDIPTLRALLNRQGFISKQ